MEDLSDGRAAHFAWEETRGSENECDAEDRLADAADDAGANMSLWWAGWFERSDEWRDEIGFEVEPDELPSQNEAA